jgi:hypothetical protein
VETECFEPLLGKLDLFATVTTGEGQGLGLDLYERDGGVISEVLVSVMPEYERQISLGFPHVSLRRRTEDVGLSGNRIYVGHADFNRGCAVVGEAE